MSRLAERLVKRLAQAGYHVGGTSHEIWRWRGQGMMNKASGEAAPTWELLSDPLRHSLTGRVVSHGETPQVRLPSGAIRRMSICSHVPLTYLLTQPLTAWAVYEDEYGRLTIETTHLPPSWS